MSRAHWRIYGTVQGVGFRYFVLRAATRLRLRGYVHNAPDGSVQVEAEGVAEAIAELRAAVASGPRQAHVTRVEDATPGTAELPFPFTVR